MRYVLFIAALFTIACVAYAQNESVYRSEEFIERYDKRILPPKLDLAQDISRASLEDLRYLRNEVYARKGFLFKDAVLRAYFQGKPWYQPIWWDRKFTITLTRQEEAFVARIKTREAELRQRNFVAARDGGRRANTANIINTRQYAALPAPLLATLDTNGFAIVPDQYMQLFEVYESNDYQMFPSFVTADLYLQVQYMFFDFLLRKLEEESFSQNLSAMLRSLHDSAMALSASKDPRVKDAAAFAAAYCAVGLRLIDSGGTAPAPASLAAAVDAECVRLQACAGMGSAFLGAPAFDYTQMRPRGHYTRSPGLERYFRAMMWLGTAPLLVEKDEGLTRAIVLASLLRGSDPRSRRPLRELYGQIADPLAFLVGAPDNLSLPDLLAVLDARGGSLSDALAPEALPEIRSALLARNPERIRPKGGSKETSDILAATRLMFFPQRYTPDAEILQRLIHVLAPEPLRPFPKGLDILAVYGNRSAERILLDTYRETASWPDYDDSLAVLRRDFASRPAGDGDMYGAWLRGLLQLSATDPAWQPFMLGDAWQKKSLNTALASWTELKHAVVLYAKQPFAAECGGNEPPPRPITVGYVEPNVAFWKHSVAFLAGTRALLERNRLLTPQLGQRLDELTETAQFLLRVSEKELRRETLTEKEYENIRLIGSRASGLTLSVMEKDDWSMAEGPDRVVALATDVYTFEDQCLQEAVGEVNCIYAVVEIDGLLYLTRGAVFSYYEFIRPSAERLTDEVWQKMLGLDPENYEPQARDPETPGVPLWMMDIIAPVKPIEAAPGSSYSSGC